MSAEGNEKNHGLINYNYEILMRLSRYFTGWSPAYYQGQEWHVRYIHPCYKQHSLLGFFAIHIGPAFFEHHLRSLKVPFGRVFLIDDNGDILLEKNSHGFNPPRNVSEKLASFVRHISAQKAGAPRHIKSHHVDLLKLQSGPWKLCFIAHDLSLFHRTMGPTGLLFLWSDLICVAIGILLLLALNMYLVHKGFIRPMRMMLNHINQERLNIQTHLSGFWGPWKRWAQLISTSFAEKQNRAIRLENTLKERMGDLSRMMDYLKKNQYQLIAGERLMSLGGTAIGIAHEMRGVLAYVFNILKRNTPKKQGEQEIATYINRCSALLDDILMCGDESGATFVSVNLNDLLGRYVKLSALCFFSQNAPTPVLIDMELPAHPLKCLGIKHQLGAALFSLVSRALESALYGYTDNKSTLPRVSIALVAHDYNCTIHIKDTGLFLGSKTQEELMQDQGKSDTVLQVASCLSIIQGHDGSIFFSEVDKNHTTVILPLHKAEVQSKSA